MRVILVGADFEENLGVGMIAATAEQAGHRVEILPFNQGKEIPGLVETIVAHGPHVVGLSIQFQHRAYEFLALAARLRHAGYGGHITCGGQFPTLAYQEVLTGNHGVDSVVLHEGEGSFVELLQALGHSDKPLSEIPGLALLDASGEAIRTKGRPLICDLDELPFAKRYRSHGMHTNVPFIPIMGGRGCWGACTYCSITSFYRDARQYGGAKLLRHRSPEDVAKEMALLCHGAGGRAIFCFHDDNFLMPKPAASVARVKAIRTALDEYGVDDIAIIGKCRPDSITPQLARELRALGVVRLYVGVENVSVGGSKHLNRGMQTKAVGPALAACHEAGIFVCYNLLIFEPDTKLDDIAENIAFIREHANHPVNFCRAEPYHGTPLQLALAGDDSVSGSYLGYDYRIKDTRAELLFRICAAAFRQRNFATTGVHNRYMGLGYQAKLLEQFHRDDNGRCDKLCREAIELTREIAQDTANYLEEAMLFAKDVDLGDRDLIERETALLGLRIAEADRIWHARIDVVRKEMEAFSREAHTQVKIKPSDKLLKLVKGMALGTFIIGAQACGDDVVDPVPSDASIDHMVVDPLPPDAGVDQSTDAGVDHMVVDPPPPDAGVDNMVVDPPPPDAGVDEGFPADPLPPDSSVWLQPQPKRLIDQWIDTTPKRAVRSDDLPLYDAPVVKLAGVQEQDGIRVAIVGGTEAIGTRWESDGEITGDGREVLWQPDSTSDSIRVGVRTKGGVAVVALRASDV